MRVLCVHPNWELYGSDRSFADAVACLERVLPRAAITVRLPRRGPILDLAPLDRLPLLLREGWTLRRRGFLRGLVVGWPARARALRAAHRDLAAHDLTYLNTIIGLDGLLAARFARGPVVVHVREIPGGFERRVLRALLAWSRAFPVFNSEATRDAFGLAGPRARVVHNGVADPGEPVPVPVPGPGSIVAAGRPLRVLVIGRLNAWKGQEVVVEALARLGAAATGIEARIVGDAFGGDAARARALTGRIAAHGLAERVHLEAFAPDPTPHYRWADVVVVPSRRPEPFGRVAIEAMAHGRAVVASRHGGLVEIVSEGETGHLVPPGDPDALAGALRGLAEDRDRVARFGAAGRLRFLARFSSATFEVAFAAAIRDALGTRDAAGWVGAEQAA